MADSWSVNIKAQDIEFVKTEAMSIKTDGYAKRSKLPRKTANAIIVQKLSENVDTGKPRSDYVNVLMEIGISRRSAYRLVGEAYKAKAVTSDNAAKVPKAPAIQTVAADVRSVQSDGTDHPATTPAPRYIQWPDEVKKAIAGSVLPPLEDIVTGIWRIGVMRRENKADKAETQPPLKQAKDNLNRYVGKFSIFILNEAYKAGWRGEAPPFGRLASITKKDPDINIPDLAGKNASVLIPIPRPYVRPIRPTSEQDDAEALKWDEQDNQINAMVPKGDEVAAFTVDGERVTDRSGEVMRFDELVHAMEFAKIDKGVAVVIHAQ